MKRWKIEKVHTQWCNRYRHASFRNSKLEKHHLAGHHTVKCCSFIIHWLCLRIISATNFVHSENVYNWNGILPRMRLLWTRAFASYGSFSSADIFLHFSTSSLDISVKEILGLVFSRFSPSFRQESECRQWLPGFSWIPYLLKSTSRCLRRQIPLWFL